MAETYPAILPGVSDSLKIGHDIPVIRTKFETGRARQRSRFENKTSMYSVRWQLSDAEHDIFEAFHRIKLNNGNDWFNISLPATQGIQTVLARFVKGQYSKNHKGVLYWVVSAKLEVEEDYGLTEAELNALLS